MAAAVANEQSSKPTTINKTKGKKKKPGRQRPQKAPGCVQFAVYLLNFAGRKYLFQSLGYKNN